MEERKSGWKWFQDHWLGIIVWVIFSATVFVLPKMMTQENPIPEGFEWGGVYWWAVRLLPALAFMLPVRAGGMDWSILPTAALSALVAAKMLNAGQQGVWVALLIGLLIGILHQVSLRKTSFLRRSVMSMHHIVFILPAGKLAYIIAAAARVILS